MIRQSGLKLLGLVAVLGFLAGGARAADDKPDVKPHEKHAEHFHHCAKECAACMLACESCARHCAHLVAEGQKEHMRTLGTCSDCSEFCAAAGRIVSHRGPMSVAVCEACTKACDTCASACEQFPHDEHMKHCAKACRDCAKACREMLKHVGHAEEAEPGKEGK